MSFFLGTSCSARIAFTWNSFFVAGRNQSLHRIDPGTELILLRVTLTDRAEYLAVLSFSSFEPAPCSSRMWTGRVRRLDLDKNHSCFFQMRSGSVRRRRNFSPTHGVMMNLLRRRSSWSMQILWTMMMTDPARICWSDLAAAVGSRKICWSSRWKLCWSCRWKSWRIPSG
jgi:hypothetical protein